MRRISIATRRLQKKAHTVTRRSAFRPLLEVLEDRTVPSHILWVNRGTATNDRDGFNDVFGESASKARAVVDSALKAWENVIASFQYSDPNLNDTYRMTVKMETEGQGLGAAFGPDKGLDGKPIRGSGTIQRGLD